MSIDAGKATMLAKRLWVDQLVGAVLPSGAAALPSVVVQTYSSDTRRRLRQH